MYLKKNCHHWIFLNYFNLWFKYLNFLPFKLANVSSIKFIKILIHISTLFVTLNEKFKPIKLGKIRWTLNKMQWSSHFAVSRLFLMAKFLIMKPKNSLNVQVL